MKHSTVIYRTEQHCRIRYLSDTLVHDQLAQEKKKESDSNQSHWTTERTGKMEYGTVSLLSFVYPVGLHWQNFLKTQMPKVNKHSVKLCDDKPYHMVNESPLSRLHFTQTSKLHCIALHCARRSKASYNEKLFERAVLAASFQSSQLYKAPEREQSA